MANPNNGFLLHDIKVKKRSAVYGFVLKSSPVMIAILYDNAMEVQRLWEARVAKRSGRLASSGSVSVPIGGRKRDRVVGKLTIGGKDVVAPELWRGQPFYYGTLHEAGSPTKRDRFPAYAELRNVAESLRYKP